MADPADIAIKIAEEVIKAITGQIDFVHALALATIAGVFAFALQVALHNKDASHAKVALLWPPLLIWAAVLEVVSLILGGAAKGALTSSIPAILQYDFSKVERLALAQYANANQITLFARGQTIFFLLGIVLLAVFLVKNRGLLR